MNMNGVAWWETWYAAGGDAGPGSRDEQAQWKADFVNRFVQEHQIISLFDYGCGSGEQACLLRVSQYVGYEPSPTARNRAKARCLNDPTRTFSGTPIGHTAELALSMDVLYHLLADWEHDSYLKNLFASATRYVLIYTTRDSSHDFPDHIRHRPPPADWTEQIDSPDPTSNCSFFVYSCL